MSRRAAVVRSQATGSATVPPAAGPVGIFCGGRYQHVFGDDGSIEMGTLSYACDQNNRRVFLSATCAFVRPLDAPEAHFECTAALVDKLSAFACPTSVDLYSPGPVNVTGVVDLQAGIYQFTLLIVQGPLVSVPLFAGNTAISLISGQVVSNADAGECKIWRDA
jgi:hypothetical protein